MRKFLFILASTATWAVTWAGPWAMLGPATAQVYVPPASAGVTDMPGSTGYTVPGYRWREQRANDDWRNNTWREQRANEDYRNNTWRDRRANEDWRQREEYTKDRQPNNAIDKGYVECGVGSAAPCQGYEKEKTKTDYTNNRKEYDYTRDKLRAREVDRYVGECAVRVCR